MGIFTRWCRNGMESECGGVSRNRTDDLLRARQALYQLSYDPIFFYYTLSVLVYQNISQFGGSGWTRTTGLTLIRGAL